MDDEKMINNDGECWSEYPIKFLPIYPNSKITNISVIKNSKHAQKKNPSETHQREDEPSIARRIKRQPSENITNFSMIHSKLVAQGGMGGRADKRTRGMLSTGNYTRDYDIDPLDIEDAGNEGNGGQGRGSGRGRRCCGLGLGIEDFGGFVRSSKTTYSLLVVDERNHLYYFKKIDKCGGFEEKDYRVFHVDPDYDNEVFASFQGEYKISKTLLVNRCKNVIIGFDTGLLLLYDLETGLFLEKIFAHPKKSPVIDLQGNTRNKLWVAILFADQSCMVYNFGTKEVTELPVGTDICPQSCGFITFHESLPNLLLLTGNRAIKVIDLDQKGKKSDLPGKEIWRLANTHKKDVTDMEITNDSKYAVSVSSDCTIKIYELEENSIFAEKRFIDIEPKRKSLPKSKKPDLPRKPTANRRSELLNNTDSDCLNPGSP